MKRAAKSLAALLALALHGARSLNTSTTTQPTSPGTQFIDCGSNVSGSTVGLPDTMGWEGGDAHAVFCPNSTSRVKISTCQSTFATALYVKGPGIDIECSSSCEACGNQREAWVDVLAGECYDIYVEGNAAPFEGDYVLSVSCPAVACGIPVYGSTEGLPDTMGGPSGEARFSFCPNLTGRVKISTCGSDFDTWLHVKSPIVDVNCDDCGDCAPQTELSVDVLADECYDIFVEGFQESEGDFVLSLTCSTATTTTVMNALVPCGSPVSGSTVGLPDTLGFRGGEAHWSFCPNSTGRVKISTCLSSGMRPTLFYLKGHDIDVDCAWDCHASCGHREAWVDVRAGECYDIIVEGYDFEQGDYTLSISCPVAINTTAVVCGSTVNGSSVGLPNFNGGPQGDARYVFCADHTGRVQVSTCGSDLDTALHVQGPGVEGDCDCGDCYWLTAQPGDCYDIFVEG